MTTVYLARHGESDWNAADRFQGHSDRPLTARGRLQAEALAVEIAEIATLAAIYSSPLRRALDTAAAVGAVTGLEPVALEGLREVDVGAWAGLSRSEVARRFPNDLQRWLDGGEGWAGRRELPGDVGSRPLRSRLARGRACRRGGARRLARRADPRDPGRRGGLDVHAYRKLHRVEPNARLSRLAVENGRISRLD